MFDSDIIKYISNNKIAHLGTCDSSGIPTVVPVCFVFHDNIIYIPLDAKPKKRAAVKLKRVKNITYNPFVSVVIDQYCEDWDRLSYVIIQGSASLINHGKEYEEALIKLCEKYEQYSKMKLHDLGLPVIKIVADKIIKWGKFD